MEHRCASRFEITLDAWVHCRGGLVLCGKTRNISVDGSFVEVLECVLNHNAIVWVTYYQYGKSLEHQKAMVVHTGPDGVGLMHEAPGKTLNTMTLNAFSRAVAGFQQQAANDGGEAPPVAANGDIA